MSNPQCLPRKGLLNPHIVRTAVKEGKKHLYIWGIAKYRDVFPATLEHITRFCVFAANIAGDPLKPWEEKTNPVDIVFANYDRHNCADDDCD